MRIFYFARIDVSLEDANTRKVLEECRQFSKLGHGVTLFVPDMGGRRILENVSIVYVPVLLRKTSVTFFTFYIFLFFVFLFYFLKKRPHVVYTLYQKMEWVVTWLHWILGFVYVLEVNGLSLIELKINGEPKWIIRVTSWIEWFLFRMPHGIVASHPRIRDILCEQYGLSPDRFHIIANGANPEIFKPMDTLECRRRLNLEVGGKYLIFVGSFKKWHSVEEFMEVFPELVRRVPNIRLLLVGAGETMRDIKSFVQKNGLQEYVVFFGEKPFEELPVYINASDICLGLFHDKPGISPLKLFEYMACGKPIVCNSTPDLDILFNTWKVGELVDASNRDEWVDKIEALIQNPRSLQAYGENGRNAVLTELNWEVLCRRISKTLEEYLASR